MYFLTKKPHRNLMHYFHVFIFGHSSVRLAHCVTFYLLVRVKETEMQIRCGARVLDTGLVRHGNASQTILYELHATHRVVP